MLHASIRPSSIQKVAKYTAYGRVKPVYSLIGSRSTNVTGIVDAVTEDTESPKQRNTSDLT